MNGTTTKLPFSSYISQDLKKRMDAHLKKTSESKTDFLENALLAWLEASQKSADASAHPDWTVVKIPPHPRAEELRALVQRLAEPGALDIVQEALAILAGGR